MSASYSGMKKVSGKGGESLRVKKANAAEWEAPQSMVRAGSKKRGSNSPSRGRAYDKKKLSKVVALFNREIFTTLNIEKVLNNWRILQYVFLSLGGHKPLEPAVNTYFVNCYRKKYNLFLQGFTKYNKIRKKIFVFMFLEFWAFYLLFYFQNQVNNFEAQVRALFEDILTHLTKNTFYVGLILLKAASNRVLDLNVGYLQDFVNRSQTFNFETGVPLIKTLRSNNENAYEGIKKVLQYTNRNLNKFFVKTYSHDFPHFDDFLAFGSQFFVNQLQSPQKLLFKKMQDSHFYGKESFSGKSVSDFCHSLRHSMTPGDFLGGSLDQNLNTWKQSKPSRSGGVEGGSKARKAKREPSHSEKHMLREESKRDRTKVSVRSKNSDKGRGKLSSKYSLAPGSQSRKPKGLLSNKNYKLKVSNSKRLKDLSSGESPRGLKDPKTSRVGALASKKKLERSLRKHSSRAFKNSRQNSVRDKDLKMSKKQKNSSTISTSKASTKGKNTLLSSDIQLKKKLSREAEAEKMAHTHSSKKVLVNHSRETSTQKALKSKRTGSKNPKKKTDSQNGSKMR